MMDIRGLVMVLHQHRRGLSIGYPRKTYFMPTPPATKTTFRTLFVSIPGGGQMKLPPTQTLNSLPSIFSSCCHCKFLSQQFAFQDRQGLGLKKLRDSIKSGNMSRKSHQSSEQKTKGSGICLQAMRQADFLVNAGQLVLDMVYSS